MEECHPVYVQTHDVGRALPKSLLDAGQTPGYDLNTDCLAVRGATAGGGVAVVPGIAAVVWAMGFDDQQPGCSRTETLRRRCGETNRERPRTLLWKEDTGLLIGEEEKEDGER